MALKNKKRRFHEILKHRRDWYEQALQRLIDGEATIDYVRQRADKVKEVEKGVRH